MYAFSEGGVWHFEQVDPLVTYFSKPSLSIDASGNPHIAYYVEWGSQGIGLKYACREGSDWFIESVDPWLGAGYRSSLAIDSQGRPHIGYSCPYTDLVRFAWKDGTTWHMTVVDSGASYSALALDSRDYRHMAYFDQVNTDLRYAFSTGEGLWVHGVPPSISDLTLRIEGPCPSTGMTPFGLFLTKPSPVNVSVFDLGGRRVRIVAASPLPEGTHRLIWDGLDDRGLRVPSGTYICSAEAGGTRASTRVVLIR
jgi:hypothetical protein